MKIAQLEFEDILAQARTGDREAAGALLDRFRPWLRILAQRQISGRIGARLDASDVIQQTCLSAYGSIQQFEGRSEGEFVAWLKRIHEYNLRHVIRDNVYREKRSLSREVALGSDSQVANRAAGKDLLQSTPSQRILADERAVRLASALTGLPAEQQEAVRLRYLEGLTVGEISERMDRTKSAIGGLLKRGMHKLRDRMKGTDYEPH